MKKSIFCKKLYIYALLAAVSLGLAISTQVFAHGLNDDPATAPDEHTPSDSGHAELSVQVQNRVINLSRNIQNRQNAAVQRLEQILSRMDSRIQKLNAQGTDTTQAEEIFMRATDKLREAKDLLATTDQNVIAAVSSDNPVKAFVDVKMQFQMVTYALQDAYTHLQTTIGLLKGSNAVNTVPAESTETAPLIAE